MAETPDDRKALHPSARSSMRIGLGEVEVIAPGLLYCRLAGYIKMEHVEQLLFAANKEIRTGFRAHLFIDADDVHGYDTEVRKVFQTWAKRNRVSVKGVWVLYRSPLVKMGLSLANAYTSGIIRGFGNSDEFDQALSEATTQARAGDLRLANLDLEG